MTRTLRQSISLTLTVLTLTAAWQARHVTAQQQPQPTKELPAGQDKPQPAKVNGPPIPCSAPQSPVDCNGKPRLNDGPGQPVTGLRGRFRVTLNGFLVNHQTIQGLLARWDTVTLFPTLGTVDSSGHQQPPVTDGGLYALRRGGTSTIGTSPESAVQGGSAGPHGGLVTGDGFPNPRTPWVRASSRSVAPGTIPPTLYFEGDLIQQTNAAYIIPTVWVNDGPSDMNLVRAYQDGIDHDRASLERIVAGMIRTLNARNLGSCLRPGASMSLNNAVRLAIGVAQERPIGMQPEREQFGFLPQVLVLTFDSAEFMARTEFEPGKGVGVVPVRYVDHASFGGDYTLYLQVERLR